MATAVSGYGVLQSGHFAYGTYTGTGSAISVTLGFRPVFVWLINTEGNCFLTWTANMGDGAGQKVADSGAGTTDVSTIASGGITATSRGFTIGADADLNVDGEDGVFIAIG